jgi:HIV Tat-specific factor 1
MGDYAAAMAREQARMAAAHKRNFAHASEHGEDADHVESAWDDVFESAQNAAAPEVGEAQEARNRKKQRKTERRAEKAAHQAANAGNWSLYVQGVPKELSYTALHSLFSKAGKVVKVKLYKDSTGEPKGDGIVQFSSEEGVTAALEREWILFGDVLTVTKASFTAKNSAVNADWPRIVVLCHMFRQEEIATAEDARAFIECAPARPTTRATPAACGATPRTPHRRRSPLRAAARSKLEEVIWLECARFGTVERVQAFAADPACPVVVRFEGAEAAETCVKARRLLPPRRRRRPPCRPSLGRRCTAAGTTSCRSTPRPSTAAGSARPTPRWTSSARRASSRRRRPNRRRSCRRSSSSSSPHAGRPPARRARAQTRTPRRSTALLRIRTSCRRQR